MRETSEARGQGQREDATGELLGREAELAELDGALDRVVRFQAPQLVTVLGPLGFGKTRLVEEWLSANEGAGLRVVRARATSGDRALMASILRARFQLDAAPDADAAIESFRAQLQGAFGDRRVADVASLLGGFLGFEGAESPLLQALAGRPERAGELARAVLCRFFEQDALERPLVIVAEDLQEADDASLDLLAEIAGELGEAPVLLLATARPELLVRRPGWGHAEGGATRLELAPLPREVLEAIAGAPGVAPELLERAIVESGGSPLLLRELLAVYRVHGARAAMTLDARQRGEDEKAPRAERTGDTVIAWRVDLARVRPAPRALTGEEAAELRLAALTPAERDVLARGAVFGGVFWTGGVVALGRLGAEPADASAVFSPDPAISEIERLLASLEERDYLVRVQDALLPGETAWGFRSTLEEARACAGVEPGLDRRRRVCAAQWLESRGGAGRELRLEALARLYEGAGDKRRAAYCLITAAADARGRSLVDRAHVLYTAAVRLLDHEDAVAKMDALYVLGDLAQRLGRTREALGHFEAQLRLAWHLDLPAKGGAAHGRLGRLHGTLGAYKQALRHLELAGQLFEIAGDAPGVAAALDDTGRVHFLMGAPDASLRCHRAALAVRERLGDDRGRALTLARLGQVEQEAGDLESAAAHFREALALRRTVGDRSGEIASLLDLGGLQLDLGNVAAAVGLLEEGRKLARDLGERLSEASFGIALGECHLSVGQPRLARKELEGAREIARQFGARVLLSEATRGLAEARLALGDTTRARDDARAAFEIAERIGAAPLVGAALRVVAASVALGAPGEPDLGGAREMFDRAVEVLSNAGAELELARTLASYAEFEASVGRRDTAHELRRQASLIRSRTRSGRRRAPAEEAALEALASL